MRESFFYGLNWVTVYQIVYQNPAYHQRALEIKEKFFDTGGK